MPRSRQYATESPIRAVLRPVPFSVRNAGLLRCGVGRRLRRSAITHARFRKLELRHWKNRSRSDNEEYRVIIAASDICKRVQKSPGSSSWSNTNYPVLNALTADPCG